MTRTIDRAQLCDDVEHGDLIPLTWDDTYGLLCTLQQLVGDLTPNAEDPLVYRSDLWTLSQHARQLARLAEELYAVAPRTMEEVEAEQAWVMRPRPAPAAPESAAEADPITRAYDTADIRGMTRGLQWLRQVLSAHGVDVQAALQAATTPTT